MHWQIFNLKFEIIWHRSWNLLKFLFLSLRKRQGLLRGGQTGTRITSVLTARDGTRIWTNCVISDIVLFFFVMLLFKKMNWRKLSHNWKKSQKETQKCQAICTASVWVLARAAGGSGLRSYSCSLPCAVSFLLRYREGRWWSFRVSLIFGCIRFIHSNSKWA